MAATNTFNADEFRLAFPEFASISDYPDAKLQSFWDSAFALSGDRGYTSLAVSTGNRILNLMTAHLLTISAIAASGGVAGNVTSSTVDEVSVTMSAPTSKTSYDYWLGLTPYGQQLLAFLGALTAGGIYVGGSLERAAFRKAPRFY